MTKNMDHENTIQTGQSIRTRILALILGLIFLSVIVIVYVSISSILSAGQDAQVIGNDILQNQAEEFLVQVTTNDALKNDANINDIRLDANHLAQFIGTIYADPDAFDSQSYWQATDNMYIAPDGQYVNKEDDTSTIFVPNFVDVNEEYNTDLNLSAYLDSLAPAILESDNNTGAVYLIHRDEFTRLYPNIGLGFLVPPDYKATDDIFYAAGTPENNPERDVVWTPVYDDPAGQGLLVSAIAPIYINKDEFIGVIGIDLSLTGLTANIEEANTIANGYSFLVNDEGLALALPPQGYEDIFEESLSSGTSGSGSDLSNVSSNFTPVIEKMMGGETGFQAIEANGKNLFVAYAPLTSTGWSLANVVEAENMLQVAAVLQEEIETSTQSLVLTRIIPISFALMIIAIIIGLVLTNRLITPIQKLADTASLVGDGDWDQVGAIDPETHRNDEIGVLATAFQKMTGQLKGLVTDLESRVAARTQDLNLAAEIGRDISQIRDLDELLRNSVERIRSRFDLYYTQIYLVNEGSTILELSAGTGMVGEALLKRGHQLPLDTKSINGQAAQGKRPVIVADTAQSSIFRPNPSLPYTRSEMAIPLLVGNNVLGVLDLQSITPGGLNEDNLSAFSVLAGQLAITLQNAALFKEQNQLTQELKENTQQFQENATFLDTILDNIPTMLFVKHAADLRYMRWNKAGSELVGIPSEAFVGKTDYDFFPKQEADFFVQKDREVLNNGILVDIPEETIESVDKGQRLLHTIKVPIMDADGKPQYLLGISQDITEQKEAERMLNERVKELNLLNEIGIKADEQPSLTEFLTYIANRIPAGMQHTELCKVAITVGDQVYGVPEAVNLPSQIVEGLSLEGEQIGRIYIAYTEKQSFINEESALIGSIGRRVTDYIANRRLLDRVQATVDGLQTVADISTIITSQQDTQQLLQNVVDLTKAQFDFYHAHIYLYDEMIDALVLSAGAGEIGQKMVGESRQIALSAPRSLVARAARERRGLVVANVKTDPNFLPHPLLPKTRSEMAVPLTVGDQLIGVMDIQSAEVNGFTPEDVNIQTTLASQIAVALQNAEQYEQTQAALDEVNALQRALTREGWQAYMTAVNRPTKGFQIAENQILPILTETSPVNDSHENSSIVYPLSVRGTAIGRIGVNTKDRTLSQDDLELLESISDQVAEALERARLFEETETARSQTEDLFSGSENVVRATTLDEILKALIQATALKNMERASIIFFDRPWQTTPPEMMTVNATWRNDNKPPQVPTGSTFPFALHPAAQYLERERPFVITDIETDPRMDENSRALMINNLNMRSAIMIPLVVGNQWLGFVMSLSSEAYTMSVNEIRQIISLTGQAATVAQSQRLYQNAQAQARTEQILREVSAKVSAAVDAESVLQTATREIGRALGLETFVYLKDPKNAKQ